MRLRRVHSEVYLGALTTSQSLWHPSLSSEPYLAIGTTLQDAFNELLLDSHLSCPKANFPLC